jgi:glycogen debranching enzyme
VATDQEPAQAAAASNASGWTPAEGRKGRQPYLHQLVTAVYAPAMALSGADGQVRRCGVQGLYVQDLRVLDRLVVTVDGAEPVYLGRDLGGGPVNRFEGALPEVGGPGPDGTVFLSRQRRLSRRGMAEHYTLSSFAEAAVTTRLELSLGCDLAGIAAVKSGLRSPALAAQSTANGLRWERPGGTVVQASARPAPDAVDGTAATMAWDVALAPGQPVTLTLEIALHERAAVTAVGAPPVGQPGLPVPEVRYDDPRLRRFVEMSLADLDGLRMGRVDRPEETFLAAGAPWFFTLFGRDSLWAARMLLALGTGPALGTLRTLARRQGRTVDTRTGEEPGKILHEVRREGTDQSRWPGGDPVPAAGSLPLVYYGTVDATPLWVCLLHDAWKWGLAADAVAGLLGPMQRCLSWLADFGCTEGGFVSYVDQSGQGLANQGWKDSHDSIRFRDGRIAQPPLALCEVQAYAYEAAVGGAELLDAFGLTGADRWREFAAGLGQRFRRRFWVEDDLGPYPAVAIDGDGAVVGSLSSNIGHLVGTGLLNSEESDLVARRLGHPDLDCGFGLRTLAGSSGGFNPLSYHCGSVWPHDTAIAITGLARSGSPLATAALSSLVEGLLGAAEAFEYRIPELYGGHRRSGRAGPLPYPAACRPQAWSAAASIGTLTALVGARPDVPGGVLRLAPAVPAGVHLEVSGLCLGDKSFTVELEPAGEVSVTGLPPGVRAVAERLTPA